MTRIVFCVEFKFFAKTRRGRVGYLASKLSEVGLVIV
jgi:hypothetical protein